MSMSDQYLDSSNVNRQTRNKNQINVNIRTQPPRRKIYDDNDFKEVVKNFYNLISEINKSTFFRLLEVAVRKIGRNLKKTAHSQQIQKKAQQSKKQLQQQQEIKKNDLYNFKKDSVFMDKQLQCAQQIFNQSFSNQLMNSVFTNVISEYPQMFGQNQQFPFSNMPPQTAKIANKGYPKFKRNSYHIAIAYTTYIKNQGTDINENQDPTSIARKKLRDTQKDVCKKEEEKQSEQVSQNIDPINQSFEEDRKKPLNKLVMELERNENQ